MEFSNEQLAQLRLSFNSIDTDHNGLLDPEELTTFMKASGLDHKFVAAIYKVFDTNADGNLSFDEFTEYLKACMMNSTDPRYLFKLIFNAIDKNQDGCLDINEMMEFGQLCGQPMTIADAKHEMDILDTDRSGTIEFDEICRAFGI